MSHFHGFFVMKLLSIVLVLWLGGCAMSPTPRFYTLIPAQPGLGTKLGTACSGATLVLGPVTLPEHLARSQLVSRETDVQLRIDEFARWGAPLPEEFRQAMATAIGARLGAGVTAVYPLQDRYEMDWRVSVDVQRFDGLEGGPVYLAAQWSVWRAGKIREFTRQAQYQFDSVSGKEEYVAALRTLLGNFVDEITTAIAPLCGVAGDSPPRQR